MVPALRSLGSTLTAPLRPNTRRILSPQIVFTPSGARLFHPGTPQCNSSKQMPPRPKPPPDADLKESYLKGSGPGGQKIFNTPAVPIQNKTNSAVQLTHIPTGIVVKSQATRSRSQNRKIARDLLAAKLDQMENGEHSRTAIVANSKSTKKASAAKKSRRKYRQLKDGQDAEQQPDAQISSDDQTRSKEDSVA